MAKDKTNLTQQEIKIAEQIAKSLIKRSIGRENAVHRDFIIEKLSQSKEPIVIDRHKLSEIIQYIRIQNLCGPIIETGPTFYISEDVEEINAYMLLLDERVHEIKNIRKAIENQLKNFNNKI